MKKSRILLILECGVVLMNLIFTIVAIAEEPPQKALYPGEKIMQGGGYPALTKFIKGDTKKALIVFIPGTGHTARISYGGHAGSQDKDFLAHWLVSQGYNFLGISYPIITKNPIYEEAYPNFNIRIWGKQAAEIAKATIDENNLSNRIILIAWSNGGRITQSFNEAATNLGLDVDFCASFSATPPNVAVVIIPPETPPFYYSLLKASNGYMALSRRFDDWYDQVKNNSSLNRGREIIPKEVFCDEYVGNMPVNLTGLGIKYQDGAFVASGWTFMEDSKSYDLQNFPLVATVVTDNVNDSRHALTDQGVWGPYVIGNIFSYIEKSKVDLKKMSPEKWKAVVNLVRTAPQQLSVGTTGNHFFFVGEAGARNAAQCIIILEEKVRAFKTELGGLLGI